jgi:hypothetical protein
MRTITPEELATIIEKHRKYLLGESGGERANLRGANLSGAYLRDANLSGANLSGAYLSDANLRDAYLSGANLSGANLSGANLRDANLRDANLSGANLRDANLSGAYLRDANLSDAYLRDANLSGANLRDANLRDANLSDANLRDANLRDGFPTIENIHQRVFEAASAEGALDMRTWHTCDTTHCRAGWVVTLAGAAGRAMEALIGTGPAAALIYMTSDPQLEKIPDWMASNESAMADMQRLADLEKNRVAVASE